MTEAQTPLELILAYHQRTKHRFEGYAPGPDTLDWDDQPAPFRRFDGAPEVVLPLLEQCDPELAQALLQPFGQIQSNAAPLAPSLASLASLAALLQLSLAVTAWKSYGPNRWPVRANPSSGNLHPVEAYIVVRGWPELLDGLYHYRPDDHVLELRASLPDSGQSRPSLALGLSTVMWRETWKYGERAFRYCQLDTGHAVACLAYAGALLGWSLKEERSLGTVRLASLLGLDRQADFPRSRHDTGREEAEILLTLHGHGVPAMADQVQILSADMARATWHGRASVIDDHPFYHWPIVDEVAVASRRADNQVAPSTGRPPSWPLDQALPASCPVPAMEIIQRRRSAQRFDSRHLMPGADFAALLTALLPSDGPPWNALADDGLSLLLFVHRVDGVAPGLYLLPRQAQVASRLKAQLAARFALSPAAGVPAQLGLLLLESAEPAALKRLARATHCHQDIAASACLTLGMIAEFAPRLTDDPGAYRDMYRQAGLLGQVLYLEAEACGLRGTGIGCFFDDPIHELLGLTGNDFQTLYHFTVGLAMDDPRIETQAPIFPRKTPT